MDLLIDSRGAALRKTRDRLVVVIDGERREFAIDDVEQVVMGPGVSITSDALLLAADHGTDVVITDWREDPRGRFVTGGLMGAALTKRNQLAALEDGRGVTIAAGIALAKCRNQANLLARTAGQHAPDVVGDAVRRIRNGVRAAGPYEGMSLADVRGALFAVEGNAGRHYMRGVAALLPAGLGFAGRTRRPPRDVVNAALSYGYGILHSQVQRGLFLVGLEPAAGFLHTDRWGRSSLTLDVMELFRQPIVDRAVLTLARRGQIQPDLHGEDHAGGIYLSADGRKLVAQQVLDRLHTEFTYYGRQATWKQAVVFEARKLASFLLGHRTSYRPYVHRWA